MVYDIHVWFTMSSSILTLLPTNGYPCPSVIIIIDRVSALAGGLAGPGPSAICTLYVLYVTLFFYSKETYLKPIK